MKKKPNVLFVEYCSNLKAGGAQRVFLDILKNIDQQHCNVFSAFPLESGVELNSEIPDGITILNYNSMSPDNSGNGLTAYLKFGFYTPVVLCRWFFLLKKNNIDVVYVHSIISGLHFALLKKLTNIRFIYHEHNIASQRRSTYLWDMLFRLVTNNADVVVAISHSVGESLLESGVDKNKIEVIHNGVEDIDEIDSITLASAGRKRLDVDNGHIIVGMIGHFRSWKGQLLFVKCAEILREKWPEVKFIIVGGIHDNEYYEQVQNYIGHNHLANTITITGHQENVNELIACMDIVVVPSIPEPFGLVVLEAMRLKKPVVAFDIGGPSEIIVGYKTGILVNNVSHDGLAEAVEELIVDEPKRIELGERGRMLFKERYTLDVQGGKILALISNLLQ